MRKRITAEGALCGKLSGKRTETGRHPESRERRGTEEAILFMENLSGQMTGRMKVFVRFLFGGLRHGNQYHFVRAAQSSRRNFH